jgi:hypothetical protein
MLIIAEDTYRGHDLQWGMCSTWVFENLRRKYHGMADGFSVLQEALVGIVTSSK